LRLLLLQPGAPFDPIKCDLVPCQLNDVQHTYDATSYTWGSPEDPPQVECNGLTMKVQRNAFDMLTDLRLCDRPRTVWIDAICINQSDVQERSQQVRMMHQVYERAKCVVVWLGRPDEDSRLAMRYAGGLNPASHIEELGDILAKKLAAAMVSLINRPWFNRVWV
ncbi:heterokaryon incompatibility, partial [Bombardia bombarda]